MDKMVFIAMYSSYTGIGHTLEEAFSDLKNEDAYVDIEDVSFYEAKELEVEIKIVQKPTVELNVKK